jgi:hypothetical protein
MSTDWRLNITDCFENDIISSIELNTMMIEQSGRCCIFMASMNLNWESLNLLNINERRIYNLNYYSHSYPENSFILKDAIITSLNCSYNSETNMHVEVSWNYFRENSSDLQYANEIEPTYVPQWQYTADQEYEDSFLINNSIEKINWQIFGF